jgi:tagaturonate reductase
MILSRYNLKKINAPGLHKPDAELFELPEKVLQFGAGVLLRGLPDYFIDKANRKGLFNGRVVVIKSTDKGSAAEFEKQDCLYTIYLKGIENSSDVNEQVICSAISRVLSAAQDWDAILDIARSPHLQVIISNTTEVGIQLVKDNVRKLPPVSFPGKLLAILYARYKAFKGSEDSGLVIIPTELIVDNGKKLEAIVLELAHLNKLEPPFMDWLERNNKFCNSLVDRIVPGRPDAKLRSKLEAERGYTDDLDIIAEPYSLWAIEGDEKIASVLSFSQADKSVVISPDIELFRELKLRLLNGTHTLSCAVALLWGFDTVQEAMNDESFFRVVTNLLFNEILPSIPYPIEQAIASDFARKVLDRFRNPNIRHEWLSVAVQYSAKMKMRVIPLLINHYKLNNAVPQSMALGFAAFLRFMKVEPVGDSKYGGSINNKDYIVTDASADFFYKAWTKENINTVVEHVLKNKELWEADLTIFPGFKPAVADQLNGIFANEQIEINAGNKKL